MRRQERHRTPALSTLRTCGHTIGSPSLGLPDPLKILLAPPLLTCNARRITKLSQTCLTYGCSWHAGSASVFVPTLGRSCLISSPGRHAEGRHQRKDDSNREVKTKPFYDELQELALGAQDQESAVFVLQCMPVCHYCAYHQSMQCSICSLFL